MIIDKEKKWVCHNYVNGWGAKIRISYNIGCTSPQFYHKGQKTFMQYDLFGLHFFLGETVNTHEDLSIELPYGVWERYHNG